MKTLILTEKSSVGMDFVKALGGLSKQDGFLESQDYIVTWAVGHLIEPFEPEEYDPKWTKWALETLPILPASFKYKPLPATAKQFKIIKSLLERVDIEKIVLATDAGREGELIGRLIFRSVKISCTRFFRFWSSQALTPEVIKDALRGAKPLAEFDRLFKAGLSRQMSDWLVGMNFSRFASLKFNGNFSVGRVQTAVLGLLVDRQREIDKFIPIPYFLLKAKFRNDKGEWLGAWFAGDKTRFDQEAAAKDIERQIVGQKGTIANVTKEVKEIAPPLLFSLTDLQQEANKKYGFSAQKTLDIAQGLYEDRKCLSYPRTDARVLGSKSVEMLRKIFDSLAPHYPDVMAGIQKELLSDSNKRVFNDAKLTDHHALITLKALPTDAKDDELKIFNLVLNRLAAAFHPDFIYEHTEVITEVMGQSFKTIGRVIVKPGWRALLKDEDKDEENEGETGQLPDLYKNDPATVIQATVESKKTTPPPRYTEASLLKDMTNPAKYVEEAELKTILKGDVGLGTQATRAQIIETVIKREYVERIKKQLVPMAKGCFLIDSLRHLQGLGNVTYPKITAAWELELERIAQGAGKEAQFMAEIKSFVQNSVAMNQNETVATFKAEPLGKCPACGGEVIEGKKGFGCANWKPENGGCKFVIWKTIAEKTINAEAVKKLLSVGKTDLIRGFTSKTEKKFDAKLQLAKENDQYKVNFVFDRPEAVKDIQCPLCGASIVESDKAFSCTGKEKGCSFTIWKTVAHKKLSSALIRELISKGSTSKQISGFKSKAGKPFEAKLRLQNGKIEFEFGHTK
jgi:DNA topoisomerase-3